MHTRLGRAIVAIIVAASLAAISIGSALAHEQREVGDYTLTVGFIDEPVYIGSKSGLEIRVTTTADEQPVEGLESSLTASVTQGDTSRDLPLSPRFGQPGWYQSYFVPTVAGAYSFHVTGDIEGTAVDETFSTGPDTFGEPQSVSAAQFPVQFPGQAELVDDAQRGADAAGQVTIALVLGGLGLVAGLAALGLSLGARRRQA
jgi:hypothetical protein